jgi:hypothetical protein
MWVSRGLQTLQATSRLRARAHNDSIGHGAWLRAVGPHTVGPCAPQGMKVGGSYRRGCCRIEN